MYPQGFGVVEFGKLDPGSSRRIVGNKKVKHPFLQKRQEIMVK